MPILDRFRIWLARNMTYMVKSQTIPDWLSYNFVAPTFRSLVQEGFRANGVVFACVSRLGLSFPEAKLVHYTERGGIKRAVPESPITALLRRPMPQMGASELLALTIMYLAISGNAYWYKVRSRRGVEQLTPLSDAHIRPIPGGTRLVSHYERQDDDGSSVIPREIPAGDIVHFKWLPDPLAPWEGMAPLRAVAREIDADNEMNRYLYALLKNDAIPRMILTSTLPGKLDQERIRAQWYSGHGGDKRGGIAILEGGLKAERLSLSLSELAMEALHRVPEARICAAFQIPPTVAGINVGIDQMTYDNVTGLRRYFTEDTLMRLWAAVGDQATAGLLPEFDLDPSRESLGFDVSGVAALQEKIADRRGWANDALTRGGITVNEYRDMIGLPRDPNGDRYLAGQGQQARPETEERPRQREAVKTYFVVTRPPLPTKAEGKALPMPKTIRITAQDVQDAEVLWSEEMPDLDGLLYAIEEAAEEANG